MAKVTKEQLQFLEKRLQIILERQPRFKELVNLLLSFGGIAVVPPLGEEEDLDKILGRGVLFSGKRIKFVKMEESQCHHNCAVLWKELRSLRIATGYALSSDGLWRQHSWCLDNNDTIVETTEKRKLYFGFVLTSKEAKEFYFWNA